MGNWSFVFYRFYSKWMCHEVFVLRFPCRVESEQDLRFAEHFQALLSRRYNRNWIDKELFFYENSKVFVLPQRKSFLFRCRSISIDRCCSWYCIEMMRIRWKCWHPCWSFRFIPWQTKHSSCFFSTIFFWNLPSWCRWIVVQCQCAIFFIVTIQNFIDFIRA